MTARAVGPWRALPEAGAAAAGANAGGGTASGDAAGASAGTASDGTAPATGAWSAAVLVCAHKLRDKRCGVAAPLIMEELRAECRRRGVEDKVRTKAHVHICARTSYVCARAPLYILCMYILCVHAPLCVCTKVHMCWRAHACVYLCVRLIVCIRGLCHY